MKNQTGDDFLANFEDWYRKNINALFNFVSYYVNDTKGAEDVTAQICENALQKQYQYDRKKGTLTNWIYGIARNCIYLHFRDQKKQQTIINTLMDSDRSLLSVSNNNPEKDFTTKEEFAEIINQLHSLTEEEKNVIALRYGAGFSYKEIADQLEIKVTSVGVVLHRVHRKLKNKIELSRIIR